MHEIAAAMGLSGLLFWFIAVVLATTASATVWANKPRLRRLAWVAFSIGAFWMLFGIWTAVSR